MENRSVYDVPCPECGGKIVMTARTPFDEMAPTQCEEGHQFMRSTAFEADRRRRVAKFYEVMAPLMGPRPVPVNAASRLQAYDKTWIKKMEQEREYKPPAYEGQQKPAELDEHIFKMAPSALAQQLRNVYKDDYSGAMRALTMYKNRAGKNLLSPDKDRIEQAKDQLRKLYHKEDHDPSKGKPANHRAEPDAQAAPANGKPIGSQPTTRTV